MVRSILIGTVSALALSAAANAADIYRAEGPGGYKDGPYVPVSTWTGFYVGVNGGYGWSSNSSQFSFPGVLTGLEATGGFGGGQIGYNWQGFGMPHLVFGVEADLQGADISDSKFNPILTGNGHYSTKLDDFGTVRGRIGYAMDRALLYFTGGFAYGNVKNNIGGVFKYDDTATGYVLGGGVEYKIAPAWSLKAEYQYLNLGKNDPTLAGIPVSATGLKVDDDAFHTVRVGLNYHVGSTYEPLK